MCMCVALKEKFIDLFLYSEGACHENRLLFDREHNVDMM